MRVIPGQYSASDHTVTYNAYISPEGEPVLVDEHRDLGDYGSSDVKLYYRNGQLLRFAEDAKRVNYGGSNDDQPLQYTLKIDFAKGRFTSGSKTVNGNVSEPDEHEISGALSQSKVALSRIDAMLSQLNSTPDSRSGPELFICDDKSRFAVTFDQDAKRAIVEFRGASRSVWRKCRPDRDMVMAMKYMNCAARAQMPSGQLRQVISIAPFRPCRARLPALPLRPVISRWFRLRS